MSRDFLNSDLDREKVKVIGNQTKLVLDRLYPDLGIEEIKTLYGDEISTFSFVKTFSSLKKPISIIALPGFACGQGNYILQEEYLSSFGVFVTCNYPQKRLHYELYLAQVADVITKQKALGHKVVVMGQSLGGSLAVVVVKKHAWTDGLILVSTPGSYSDLRMAESSFFKLLRQLLDFHPGGIFTRLIAKTYAVYFNTCRAKLPDGFPRKFETRFRRDIKLNSEAVRSRGVAFLRAMKAVNNYQAPLSSISTLLIDSKIDRFSIPLSPSLRAFFPTHKVVSVPGTHSAMLKFPNEYNRVIASWLASEISC